MSLWSRLTNAIRPGSLDSDLQEELQFHVEARTRALMDEGLSQEEAAALAATQILAPRFGLLLTWSLAAAGANDWLQAGFSALTAKADARGD